MTPLELPAQTYTDRLGTGRTVILALGLYFLANVALRLILPHGLELDEAEQTFLSQWMLAGYGSQPPFYNWLQHGAISLFGMSLVTLSGLKNLLLFSSYLLYYLAARQVMQDKRMAVVAALGLLTIPQVGFEAQRDLSHTVAAIFGASLFLYSLLRTLSAPTLQSFLLFGLATGIGGITKYNFAVLPIAAGLAVLIDRDMRRTMLNWRILPAALLALAIVTPHAVWLLENFGEAGGHTLEKLASEDTSLLGGIAQGFGSLALAVLGFLSLTVAIFAAVFREHAKAALAASNRWTTLVGRILGISLGLIVLMILFAGLENVRDRWLTPILLAAPLYLALKLEAARIPALPGLKRFWTVAVIIMLLVPAALFGRATKGLLTGDYAYVNIPFSSVARTLAERAAGASTIIIAGDGQLGGNIHYNLPQLPVRTVPPPVTMAVPSLAGYERAVFVWRRKRAGVLMSFNEAFAEYLRQQGINTMPGSIVVVDYPYQWGRAADQYQFGYAVLDLTR